MTHTARAKKGKGKPMDEQAAAFLRQYLDLSSRHQAKADLDIRGGRSTGRIHSLRTFEHYSAALGRAGEWARERHGLRHLSAMTSAQAQEYLEHRATEKVSQHQLDADRNVLEYLTGKGSLGRVEALVESKLTSRFYTPVQVEMVQRCQSPENALATRIAYEGGLRAHELLTLRRIDEDRPSAHRTWRPERFEGRFGGAGVRYVVTGKGGLKREIMISRETAARLEELRLESPRTVADRGIRYQQVYDLSGGNRWAVSFSAASERALRWSRGAHGLRHSYAQERMRQLTGLRGLVGKPGLDWQDAKEVVSQEMGHFRADIVNTYLR